MQLRYIEGGRSEDSPELLAIAVPKGTRTLEDELSSIDEALDGALQRALATGDITGRLTDEVLIYGSDRGPARVLLLGIGPASQVTREVIRRFAGRAVRVAERLRLKQLTLSLDGLGNIPDEDRAQSATEGAALAAWRFSELMTPEEEDSPSNILAVDLVGEGDTGSLTAGVAAGAATARGENFARTLQSRPGNIATPSHLADEATRMAHEFGLGVTVFDEARLEREGMHAILAVSRGSVEEARLIILEHKGGADGHAPLVLVGKGLSFDAGGISLKPPAGMESMKFDMSGGAAVIGAMQAIAELEVKANVVGLVPSSENLPSGSAVKPGDVIQSLAGKTIEVINTDAEGRLILADVLAYGAALEPEAMVDCATLTGGVVVALGHHAAGVLGKNDSLVNELISAGEASGERCWRLPLWDEYRRQLDSTTADLKNIGGREGSTISAACFLAEFVRDTNWAHLDIAGTAYGDGKVPYQREGGYGVPTRLLVEWVRSRVG